MPRVSQQTTQMPFIGHHPMVPHFVTAWATTTLPPPSVAWEGGASLLKPLPTDPGHWVIANTRLPRRAAHSTSHSAAAGSTGAANDSHTPPSDSPQPFRASSSVQQASVAKRPTSAKPLGAKTNNNKPATANDPKAKQRSTSPTSAPKDTADIAPLPPPVQSESPTPAAAPAADAASSEPKSPTSPSPRSTASPHTAQSPTSPTESQRRMPPGETALSPREGAKSSAGSVSPPRSDGTAAPRRTSPLKKRKKVLPPTTVVKDGRITPWEMRRRTPEQVAQGRILREQRAASREARLLRGNVLQRAVAESTIGAVTHALPTSDTVQRLLSRACIGHFA